MGGDFKIFGPTPASLKIRSGEGGILHLWDGENLVKLGGSGFFSFFLFFIDKGIGIVLIKH